MGIKPKIETAFERALFRSRWLIAPFYVGLVLALVMLLAVFMRDLAYYLPQAFAARDEMDSNGAILAVLLGWRLWRKLHAQHKLADKK